MKSKTLDVRTANYTEPTIVEISVATEIGFLGSDTSLENLWVDDADDEF